MFSQFRRNLKATIASGAAGFLAIYGLVNLVSVVKMATYDGESVHETFTTSLRSELDEAKLQFPPRARLQDQAFGFGNAIIFAFRAVYTVHRQFLDAMGTLSLFLMGYFVMESRARLPHAGPSFLQSLSRLFTDISKSLSFFGGAYLAIEALKFSEGEKLKTGILSNITVQTLGALNLVFLWTRLMARTKSAPIIPEKLPAKLPMGQANKIVAVKEEENIKVVSAPAATPVPATQKDDLFDRLARILAQREDRNSVPQGETVLLSDDATQAARSERRRVRAEYQDASRSSRSEQTTTVETEGTRKTRTGTKNKPK